MNDVKLLPLPETDCQPNWMRWLFPTDQRDRVRDYARACVEAALSAQPRPGGGDAWPASVRDEALEVLRNVDTQLSATGQASARIERLINVLAGMKTTAPQPASSPVGVEEAACTVLYEDGRYLHEVDITAAARRIAAIAQQPVAVDRKVIGGGVVLPRYFFDFLLGQGALEGFWFGDRPATGQSPLWWRSRLRALAQPQGEGE